MQIKKKKCCHQIFLEKNALEGKIFFAGEIWGMGYGVKRLAPFGK
jgi:hypothetical protein